MKKFIELTTEELKTLKGGIVIENYTIDPWGDDVARKIDSTTKR